MMCNLSFADEQADIFRNKWIKKSRREHVCSSCGATIPKGSEYAVHFSVYDGDAHNSKSCKPCMSTWEDFLSDHELVRQPDDIGAMLRECLEWEGPRSDEAKQWRPALASYLRRRRAAKRERRTTGV